MANELLEALNVIGQIAVNVKALNLEESKAIIDRDLQKEAMENQKNQALLNALVTDAQDKKRTIMNQYQPLANSFKETYGKLPKDVSDGLNAILSGTYDKPISNFEGYLNNTNNQIVKYTELMDSLRGHERNIIEQSKLKMHELERDYSQANIPDFVLDEKEFKAGIKTMFAGKDKYSEVIDIISTMEGTKDPSSIGYANNNPGNIIYGGTAKKYGGKKSDRSFYDVENLTDQEVSLTMADGNLLQLDPRQKVQLSDKEFDPSPGNMPESISDSFDIKQYTYAEFDSREDGRKALAEVIKSMSDKHDTWDGFVEEYANLDPGSSKHDAYTKALNAIDISSLGPQAGKYDEFVIKNLTDSFYSQGYSQRMNTMRSNQQNLKNETINSIQDNIGMGALYFDFANSWKNANAAFGKYLDTLPTETKKVYQQHIQNLATKVSDTEEFIRYLDTPVDQYVPGVITRTLKDVMDSAAATTEEMPFANNWSEIKNSMDLIKKLDDPTNVLPIIPGKQPSDDPTRDKWDQITSTLAGGMDPYRIYLMAINSIQSKTGLSDEARSDELESFFSSAEKYMPNFQQAISKKEETLRSLSKIQKRSLKYGATAIQDVSDEILIPFDIIK